MSGTTKQHYIKTAEVIRQAYDEVRHDSDGAAARAIEGLTTGMARIFTEDNERFDVRRFHLAALGHIDVHLANIEREGSDA